LRKMAQDLSCALARSPGARSLAWAELAAFWEAGLPPAPVRSEDVLACAGIALIGEGD
jgi:hypothetical protein